MIPNERFVKDTSFLPPLCALVSAAGRGTVSVQVMNTYEHPVTILPDQYYGVMRLACDPEQHKEVPWRVAVVAETRLNIAPVSNRPGNKPTLRQRLAEVVKKNQERRAVPTQPLRKFQVS